MESQGRGAEIGYGFARDEGRAEVHLDFNPTHCKCPNHQNMICNILKISWCFKNTKQMHYYEVEICHNGTDPTLRNVVGG